MVLPSEETLNWQIRCHVSYMSKKATLYVQDVVESQRGDADAFLTCMVCKNILQDP